MIQDERHGRRPRRTAVVVAVLLVLAGAAAIVVALTSQQHAPQPPAGAAAESTPAASASGIPGAPTSSAAGTASKPPAPAVAPLPAAKPVHLSIPALEVSSDLLDLGLNPDGTLEVPPLAKDSRAGWYRGSPAPGQLGPSVLLGHVDSAEYGPGIFFRLGALRPGDMVSVTRADFTTAKFRVDRVVSYPKNRFPTLEVYGNTDDSELRLITCGGAFDPAARSYLNNIVVYASLVSTARA